MGTELEKTNAEDGKKEEVKFTNVSVMYVDDPNKQHIILPKGMKYDIARAWLTKIEAEQNRLFNFHFRFKAWYPFDAMWALYRALAEVYGFAHVADFEYQTMFGKMKEPPRSIVIDVGYGRKQQIPWGPIAVTGLSAPLTPKITFDNGLPALELSAEIKNHERPIADSIIAKAEEILRTSSIYRGQAVEIDFTIFNPRDIQFDVERSPKFMDTKITEDELIVPDEVRDLIETNVWTPVRHAQVCREQQIPLRRSVLMAGKYGVGKTLTARVTAMLCEKNGWTFLYLRNLEHLQQALYFAQKYEPCCIFAEDINRVVSGDRDAEMDKIFNTMDGVDRKNHEVMTIFTTNDVDEIHAGMLRPGRIDAVITITPPDAIAAAKLVRHYGRTIVDPEANLEEVGVMLAGQIPAIIREAVERSKLAAIKNTKSGEKLVVRAQHLKIAAHQMLEHAKLLVEPEDEKPDLVVLGESIGQMIADGMRYRDPDTSNDASAEEDSEILARAPKYLLEDAGRPQNGKRDLTK